MDTARGETRRRENRASRVEVSCVDRRAFSTTVSIRMNMKRLNQFVTNQIIQSPQLVKVRNNREQLIVDIVNATAEKNKHKLARALAVAANVLQWQDSDLHTLLQKRNDP